LSVIEPINVDEALDVERTLQIWPLALIEPGPRGRVSASVKVGQYRGN